MPPKDDGKLSGIFVPWAGSRLIAEGGIYYIGMATNGWPDEGQTYQSSLDVAESLCTKRDNDLARTPFWQFLDGLTWALFGGPFDKTSDRWGWSNLLKIGWSVGNPNQWRQPVAPTLIDAQRTACILSLRKEFKKLHNSLIIIVSANTFGVLDSPELFPKLVPQWKQNYEDAWNKDYHLQTGMWSFTDQRSGNLYIHGYHPGYAVRASDSFWGSALGRTIHLARGMPQFASKRPA